MKHDFSSVQEVSLPLSTLFPEHSGHFANRAKVLLIKGKPSRIQCDSFLFEEKSLKKIPDKGVIPEWNHIPLSETMPVFSVIAVILLIAFRNLFHASFSRYFIGYRLNYEIDLSLQKVGIPSLLISVLVVYFIILDYLRLTAFHGAIPALKAAEILFYPLVSGFLVHFFLSISPKIFPLLFPDLKVVFLLSLILVVCNFGLFSKNLPIMTFAYYLPAWLAGIFMVARSILYFGVFRKYFRYRRTLSLFYICTLNLVTCLVVHRVFY